MTKKVDIDMSPHAVTMRLEEIRALYKLMVYLAQADIQRATPLQPKPKPD